MSAAPRAVEIVDAFVDVRALVVGGVLLDSYLSGHCERLCREAPVPVLSVGTRVDVPGGAGNTAANAAALGARVRLLSAVGDDDAGRRLRVALQDRGVPADDLVLDRSRCTSVKHRLLDGAHLLLRFDEDAAQPASPQAVEEICRRLHELAADCDVVVVSDYAQGVVCEALVRALGELRAARPELPVVVDSGALPAFRGVGVSVAKLNREEAEQVLGLRRGEGELTRLRRHAADMPDLLGVEAVVLTLDADGALLARRGSPVQHIGARPVQGDGHTTGAGDTFVAALALALAAGGDAETAVAMAVAAAGVVVGREGTSACGLQELRARFDAPTMVITDLGTLRRRIEALRRQGGRVVLTNGCFDILHAGHVLHLEEARALGDLLVVAVNDDAGVRRLKGTDRPVNTLRERIDVLCGLSSVDVVVPFAGDRPLPVIEAVRPDVYVKGGDWTSAGRTPEVELVERLGGRVELLRQVEDLSTTRVIQRIRGVVSPFA
jgi:D-beta-D-heptose 7-phosphate kinase / D-beta-D-heptose 1-phosphate adenosyltransferase